MSLCAKRKRFDECVEGEGVKGKCGVCLHAQVMKFVIVVYQISAAKTFITVIEIHERSVYGR